MALKRFVAFAVVCVLGLGPATVQAQGSDDAPTGVEGMAPELKASPKEAPGWLGVQLEKTEPDEPGVDVRRVLRSSPAQEAGLEKGDRLTRVGDDHVTSVATFQKKIRENQPGDSIELHLERDDRQGVVEVKLAEAPGTQALVEREFDGHRAPEFSARLVDQKKAVGSTVVERDDLEGKPVVLEFWASWCMPCRPLTKRLGELEEDLGDEVYFLGLSSEEHDDIEGYLERYPPPFQMAAAEEEVMESFLIESYPTVFVLDAEGNVAEIFVGTGHHRAIKRTLEKLVED
ncbi:MAG: PDZ domain-containing protein [Persicimonas sp.]